MSCWKTGSERGEVMSKRPIAGKEPPGVADLGKENPEEHESTNGVTRIAQVHVRAV